MSRLISSRLHKQALDADRCIACGKVGAHHVALSRKRIIEMVQKLEAHAESAAKIGNPEEAKTFADKAKALRETYNLDQPKKLQGKRCPTCDENTLVTVPYTNPTVPPDERFMTYCTNSDCDFDEVFGAPAKPKPTKTGIQCPHCGQRNAHFEPNVENPLPNEADTIVCPSCSSTARVFKKGNPSGPCPACGNKGIYYTSKEGLDFERPETFDKVDTVHCNKCEAMWPFGIVQTASKKAMIGDPNCGTCEGRGMVKGERTGRWVVCPKCVRHPKKADEDDSYIKIWASTMAGKERIWLDFPGDFVAKSQAAAEYSELNPDALVSVLLYEDGFTSIDRYHKGQLLKTDEIEGEYKIGSKTASLPTWGFTTFRKWYNTVKDAPKYMKIDSVLGAFRLTYKNQDIAYLGFPIEAWGLSAFITKEQDKEADQTWDNLLRREARKPMHDDSGAQTGLRRRPDYGESDSYTSEMNEANKKGGAQPWYTDPGTWKDHEKSAGPLNKVLLPAALSLGLGLAPAVKDQKPPKPPVIEQVAPAPVAGPLDPEDVTAALRTAAKATHIPLAVLAAIAHNETSYGADPAASTSDSGGLMQMTPDALAEVNKVYGTDYIMEDMADPDTAALAAAQYLRILLKKFDKDLDATIAAYNTGPAHVNKVLAQYGEVTPETLAAAGHNTTSNYLMKAKARLGPSKISAANASISSLDPDGNNIGFVTSDGREFVGRGEHYALLGDAGLSKDEELDKGGASVRVDRFDGKIIGSVMTWSDSHDAINSAIKALDKLPVNDAMADINGDDYHGSPKQIILKLKAKFKTAGKQAVLRYVDIVRRAMKLYTDHKSTEAIQKLCEATGFNFDRVMRNIHSEMAPAEVNLPKTPFSGWKTKSQPLPETPFNGWKTKPQPESKPKPKSEPKKPSTTLEDFLEARNNFEGQQRPKVVIVNPHEIEFLPHDPDSGSKRKPSLEEQEEHMAAVKTAGPLGNDVFPDGPSDFFEPVRDRHSERNPPEPNDRMLKLKQRTGLTDQALDDLMKKQKDIDVTYNDINQPGIPVGASAEDDDRSDLQYLGGTIWTKPGKGSRVHTLEEAFFGNSSALQHKGEVFKKVEESLPMEGAFKANPRTNLLVTGHPVTNQDWDRLESENFKVGKRAAGDDKKPYEPTDEDLPEGFFDDKPFAEQPKPERKMWVPRTMLSRLIAARRKQPALPKAELLIWPTPRYMGEDGPFIRITGFWGSESDKITRHLNELGITIDQKISPAELPAKLKAIYDKLSADPELIVEERDTPAIYGAKEIAVKVAKAKKAGASDFSAVGVGKTAEEAFRKAVAEARAEAVADAERSGGRYEGYSGGIAEKRNFVVLTPPKGVKPLVYAQWVMSGMFGPDEPLKDTRRIEYKEGQKCPQKGCNGTISIKPKEYAPGRSMANIECSAGHTPSWNGGGGKFYYYKSFPIRSTYIDQIRRDAQKITDKWGPAGAVQLSATKWYFFGIASS